jgi:hypothetical protein
VTSLKWLPASLCSVFLVLGCVSVLAHQETFKGKVLSVKGTTVEVSVVNPKTRKAEPTTFKTDGETKVLRGDVVVPFEKARIRKDENIAITVDHDLDITLAQVIRLAAAK